LQLSDDFDTLGTGVCTGGETNLVNALAAGGPVYSNNSSVVYAMTNGYGPLSGNPGGEVWVTTNAGVTSMTNVTGNVNPAGYAIAAVAMDESDLTGGTAYIGIMGFSTPTFPTSHVWKTTNAGTGWTDWTGTGLTALPNAPVNALLVDQQAAVIYAGTDVGVFVSSTTAPSWTEAGPVPGQGVSGFLPNAPVTALQIFNDNAGTKTLVASTYGRGVWNYALLPNFAITVTAAPNATITTQNVTWNGMMTALDGFTGSVALSCGTGHPGTCVLPATITPTAAGVPFTATLGSSTAGTFNFEIQATKGTLTHSTPTETLTVKLLNPDFTIAVTPTPSSTGMNQNITWNGTLTSLDGYSKTVTLSCTGGAPGTCSIAPPTVTPTAMGALFTVTLGSATAGTFNFKIQGTDGTLTHATPIETLTVTGGGGTDVAWTDTGGASVTLLAGQSATYSFSAAPVGASSFTSAVNFGCANLPAFTNCVFSPAFIAPGAGTTAVTLTISTCGPNLPTLCTPGAAPTVGSRQSANAHPSGAPFFMFAWVIAIGIIGFNRYENGRPHTRPVCLLQRVAVACLALGLLAQLSCGGLGSNGTKPPPPPPVTVTVNPGLATRFANETGNSWPVGATQQQFSATVNGSTDQTVTWTVAGGTPNGAVDATGLYTAPEAVPNPATVIVSATSDVASTPGSAFVNIALATLVGTSQITVTAMVVGGSAHGDVVTLIVQ
jgi:hypothetical protein